MTPTVRVDEEVYEQLKTHAEPFVDTPNSVLRRLLGLDPASSTDEIDETAVKLQGGPVILTSVAQGLDTQPIAAPLPATKQRAAKSGRKSTTTKRTRVASGTLLAEEKYEVPLLTSLIEMGGAGPSKEVIESVGKKLDGQLTDVDRATLNSGGIRWQSRVQFVRLRMIEQGLMLKETGRGIWGISDAGRGYVAQQKAGVA